MFLYEPKTEDQEQELIDLYQRIIDEPFRGFIHLLFVPDHYRFYFITRHEKRKLWRSIMKWADGLMTDNMTAIGKLFMYIIIAAVFSYYGICWLSYTFKIIVNFKKIREEAPLNLLKLA